jgi:hypothetical protein
MIGVPTRIAHPTIGLVAAPAAIDTAMSAKAMFTPTPFWIGAPK